MNKDSDLLNPNTLYDLFLEKRELINPFWGNIGSEINKLSDQISFENNETDADDLDKLKVLLRNFHIEHSIYSQKVEDNIQRLNFGSVMAGQQPVILGGPGFIANKISILSAISEVVDVEGKKIAPIFMVGDYDGYQKELYRTYFPNPISPNAVILDANDSLEVQEDTVIHRVEIPDEKWLENVFLQIDQSINGFKSSVKPVDKKKLLDERLAHIKTLIRFAHSNSKTFPDFFVKIWGTISNKINDLGIVFLPTSHPDLRELLTSQYFKILCSDDFHKIFNKQTEELIKLGYKPSLPQRDESYLPFSYECPCSGYRVNISKSKHQDGFLLYGQCSVCKKDYEFLVKTEEDLKSIIKDLGPRVESSQAIVQNILNIKIRISGPGEIAYYAQVSNAINAIPIKTPIYFRYKRAFYNSNWIEKLGKELEKRNIPSLQNQFLFKILRDQVTCQKSEDLAGLRKVEIQLREFIHSTFLSLLKVQHKSDPSKYLSWQFGRFTKEKFGQEVSWIWIDLALLTGLADYIPTYIRSYNPVSSPHGFNYLNTQV